MLSAIKFCSRVGHVKKFCINTPLQTILKQTFASKCIFTHFLINLAKSEIYVVGKNSSNQMGIDVEECLVPTPFEFDEEVVSMSCGENHSALITKSGALYTWGTGQFGILGHGDDKDVYEPKQVSALKDLKIKQVICAQNHTLALSDDGYVFSWGYGGGFIRGPGALGHGDLQSLSSPAVIEHFEKANIVIKQIAAGAEYSLALTNDGKVYSWGQGHLGTGSSSSKKIPTLVELLEEYTPVKQIVCGSDHSIALGTNGKVYSWGKNDQFQLGLGNTSVSLDMYALELFPKEIKDLTNKKVTYLHSGGSRSLAFTENGKVFSWGRNTTLEPIEMIILKGKNCVTGSCSESCFAVSTDEGKLYTWGSGRSRTLGHGNKSNQSQPLLVKALEGKKVRNVWCGLYHNYILCGEPMKSSSENLKN